MHLFVWLLTKQTSFIGIIQQEDVIVTSDVGNHEGKNDEYKIANDFPDYSVHGKLSR